MPLDGLTASTPQTSSDQLLVATIQRIQPLLGSAVRGQALSDEIARAISALGFDRCSVWRSEADASRAVYRYERPGSPLSPAAQSLGPGQDPWLHACLQGAAPARTVAAGRIRCAVPMSETVGKSPAYLLEVECHASRAERLEGHTDSSLQFMSDIICALFCYLGK